MWDEIARTIIPARHTICAFVAGIMPEHWRLLGDYYLPLSKLHSEHSDYILAAV
jgi:hypothetical protein